MIAAFIAISSAAPASRCYSNALVMSSTRATMMAGALMALFAAGSGDGGACRHARMPPRPRDGQLVDRGHRRARNSVAAGNLALNCRLLRQNLDDMLKARDPMDFACITGHDHDENLGQIDASIGDIRAALAQKCGK